ncbi:MAG: discoidin domain-containing protein [Clostridia bacterium]|nr:discoidin domain-containing protein [Clostridia bacterium]
MNNGYNNGQNYNQQNYNQQNFQGNNQPYQGNNRPGKSSGGSGKTAIIILSVLLGVVLLGLGIGAAIHFGSNGITGSGSSNKVIAALEDGKYSEALQEYENIYGYGKSDVKLNDALVKRLLEIEDKFRDEEITYNVAVKEIETIRSMGIKEIEDDIQQTAEYVEKLEKMNSETEVGTVVETVVIGNNDPDNERLEEEDVPPPAQATISSNPSISYASTIKGSVLGSSNVNGARSFGADKAIDGCYDSCWCVNTSSTAGAGGSIRFNLTQKSWVSGVQIVNGNLYMPYDDLYSLNGQVKSFTLTFSDGSSQTFTASYNGNGSSSWQTFRLNKPVATDYIILTVNSGYVGSKYTTNVCLGELDVF